MTSERVDLTHTICATISWLAFLAFAAVSCERCHAASIADEANDPVETKAALEGCHAACAPGQVRNWTPHECVCD